MTRSVHVNVLAGPYIDRAVHRRKDVVWLEQAANDPRTLFIPVWRSQNLVAQGDNGLNAVVVERTSELLLALEPAASDRVFLGIYKERACFAVGIDARSTPQFACAQFQDLRPIIGALPSEEAGLLAYARALITWRERHRYCSACGAPARTTQGGHVAQCSNEACAIETFPRIDPAIIVLVTDGERVLLGRQANWRPGWYSTIAGFCEQGESLEDAVIREVREETGIVIDEVRYHSSQPWPFPASLMLGFMAHATTTDIQRSDDELEDVRWFTREQIASGMVMIPAPISISGCLIRDWYEGGAPRRLQDEPAARSWPSRAR